jgi:murein DD-endopeptidase MepM/ murein hydrolase activator NlpD
VSRLDRSDLNVLVVRGDGRYVRWVSVPRWLAKAGLVVGGLALIANVAALVHYAAIFREHTTLVATNDVLERDAKALAPIKRRLAEVRDEMAGWDTLHQNVWKPLGGSQRPAGAGVGGPAIALSPKGKAVDDIEALLAHAREESRRLRLLVQVARDAGGILAALPSKLPLRSGVNSGFGARLSPWTREPEFHAGIDLAASSGTPVKASAPGVVRFAGVADGYGKSVILDHGAGVESRYGHLQTVGVARGQRVEIGQPIGLSGNSGRSTAPHLHYEVRVDGRPVDPRRLVRESDGG